MTGLRARTPDLVFVALLATGAAALVFFGRGLTFFFDEWQLTLAPHPLAPSHLVEAHNGQIFLVPTVIYGLLLEVFGMTSQLPFRLVNLAAATACAALLFVFVRRRTSPGLALVSILPVLVLGSAWETLLLGLSMNFTIGLAAGLGMLLVLEARSDRGDRLACGLLVLSLASGGIGLAFAAGAMVDLLARRDPRRIWIVGLPLLLFLAWQLIYGGDSGTPYVDNLLDLPGYLLHAVLAGFGALIGVVYPEGRAVWVPRLLAIVAVVAVVARLVLIKRPVPTRALVVGVVLLAFWVLGGLAMGEGRGPDASRYQYASVVLLIALAACLLEGVEVPRRLPLMLLPFALVATALNLDCLKDGRDFLWEQTTITRAATGQLEISARGMEGLTLNEEITGSPYQRTIVSGPYLRAVDRFGSPAYDERQIETAPQAAREAADGVAFAAAIFGGAD
ncbi:MAG: hypothetical protein J0H98_10060 [Solirubrobacterales bacterium]|nr:hypothetical protein [Solirubrobacterales bacterium]